MAHYAWISAFDTSPQSPEELFRNAAEKCPDVSIQIVDLDKIPGLRYLKLATVNATKSFHSKQPIAKTLGMELLLYISAEKQITRALKRIGITADTRRIAAVVVGTNRDRVLDAANFLAATFGREGDDKLLDDWPRERIKNVRSSFDIEEKELGAIIQPNETEPMVVERLAVERSAMLAAKR
jgi:KEOPS complex subunit Cgi121